jgi:hypothetical protein
MKRVDALYSKGMETGNLQAVAASIDQLRKIGGIDKPVSQGLRLDTPDGSPIGQFIVPERNKVE